MTLVLAAPVGLAIGLLLGALGGGGSILAVPALVYLLNQSPLAATTGSLVVVGLSALTAMVAHRSEGHVRVTQGVVFGLLGVVGAYLGTQVSAAVDPELLLAGFAVLMVVAAAGMLLRRSPTAESTTDLPLTVGRAARVVIAASMVGFLTGFFGVGGGFVAVPALVLALGFDMPTAVGTSLLVIVINTGGALAARAEDLPTLNWPLLAIFAGAAMAGSIGGQRITTWVRPRTLSISFALLCLGVASFVFANTLPHLLSA